MESSDRAVLPADSIPVTVLKGVGVKMAERLARLNISTVQDLLFHLPVRYQDRTRMVALGELQSGMAVSVQGEIQHTEVKFGRRRMLLSSISDGTGTLVLRFFHFGAAQKAALARGAILRCFGEVREGLNTLEMIHPEYHLPEQNDISSSEHLTPIYRVSEGVYQSALRSLVGQALVEHLQNDAITEWLPAQVREKFDLLPLAEALDCVHRPPADTSLDVLDEQCHPAQRRLAFEELLAHHLSLRKLRSAMQHHSAPPLKATGRLTGQFLTQLPFSITSAQQRVWQEIQQDLAHVFPMQRLVQGDVGSGKTVVAVLAALQAVEAGFQAAIMVPTELLAEQHYTNFRHWLEPLGLEVAWLSGQLRTAEKKPCKNCYPVVAPTLRWVLMPCFRKR